MDWEQRFRAYQGEWEVSKGHHFGKWLLESSMISFWQYGGIAHPDRSTREFSDFAVAWLMAINLAMKVPVEVIEP